MAAFERSMSSVPQSSLSEESNRQAPNRPDAGPADQVEVSVVIPCLNEAQSIAICIDKALTAFRDAGIRGEVVVADNGSDDGSIEIAQRHGARVVQAPSRGYGSALQKGIDESEGRFIIMGDADDSYDFAELPRFAAKWREGYEFVVGNRLRGEIKNGAMPWAHRYIGTPVLSRLLNLFFRAGIGDVNCGMRGLTKDLYRRLDLRTTGMEFASESLIKAAKIGARVAEIPITLWPDKRGRPPHLRSFHDGWRHLRFMLLFAPNWLFLLPGTLLFVLGAGLVLWLLPGTRWVGRVGFSVHTMFFGMIFALLGVQIIFTGFFAKIFSYSSRFDRQQRSLERLLGTLKLEHGLILGAALALMGFAGDARVFYLWAAGGFGEARQMGQAIFWSLWFFVGVQVIFASFLLSMLGISRGIYIGDYELR